MLTGTIEYSIEDSVERETCGAEPRILSRSQPCGAPTMSSSVSTLQMITFTVKLCFG